MRIAPIPTAIVLTGAALGVGACGSGSEKAATPAQTTPAATARSARALDAPFTLTVAGRRVTIAADDAEGVSSSDQLVAVVCANLGPDGFADRVQATTTWRRGAATLSVTLPRSAAGLDLCAISFTDRPGKQAVAFFDAQAKADYLADQQGSG